MNATRLRTLLAGVLLLLAGASQAPAANIYWQLAGEGDWSVGLNWSTTTGPTSADSAYVNNLGTVDVTQPGAVCNYLYLDAGGVILSGSGQLTAGYARIANSGTSNATFAQSGGSFATTNDLIVAANSGAIGAYSLSAGQLTAKSESVGSSGMGTLTQTGGINTVTSTLTLGANATGNGTYQLSGTAQLTALSVVISPKGAGTFAQTGGTATAGLVTVGTTGQYQLGGGTLQVSSGLALPGGTLDFMSGPGALSASNAIVDFSNGTIQNAGAATLTIGPNSLLLLKPSQTTTSFGALNNSGMVHTVGATLTVLTGQGFSGIGTITDFVDVQGGLIQTGTLMNLTGGLFVSGTGKVDLGGVGGGGQLISESSLSGIADSGSLIVTNEYVGYRNSDKAIFTQTGGTNHSQNFWVGYTQNFMAGVAGSGTYRNSGGTHLVDGTFMLANMGDFMGGVACRGGYELSGAGTLTVSGTEIVGWAGYGTFIQTGGSDTAKVLVIGGGATGAGTFQLSDGALTVDQDEIVGSLGGTPSRPKAADSFTQTGGTHIIGGNLYIGYQAGQQGASGNFTLSGSGQLTVNHDEYLAYASTRTSTFTQTGGTHTVGGELTLGYTASSNGVYQLNGPGQLTAGTLNIGYLGTGDFSIGDPAASVTVTNVLSFGRYGVFTAASGSAIHISGTAMKNLSLSSTSLSGLGYLNLIVEGGPSMTTSIEAAGKDQGAVAAGWTDNFVLGTLTLGGAAAGRIRLVDNTINQVGPGPGAPEALYVNNLVMNAGAAVDLNGLNLYYMKGGEAKQLFPGDANLDGIVDMTDYITWFNNFGSTAGIGWTSADFNGDNLVDMTDYITWFTYFGQGGSTGVPEPGTLALVALGGAAMIGPRRGRRG
ncbi:MAG: beta strand repeat-containing protein [Phycisphaerae bacterium]